MRVILQYIALYLLVTNLLAMLPVQQQDDSGLITKHQIDEWWVGAWPYRLFTVWMIYLFWDLLFLFGVVYADMNGSSWPSLYKFGWAPHLLYTFFHQKHFALYCIFFTFDFSYIFCCIFAFLDIEQQPPRRSSQLVDMEYVRCRMQRWESAKAKTEQKTFE